MIVQGNEITLAHGDWQTIVTHNYCDTATWPAVNDCTFSFGPSAGKRLYLRKAEVQFLHDIQLQGITKLLFDTWVYNPADLPNKVLYNRIEYASLREVLEIGNEHSSAPAGVDGETHGFTTIHFNYPRAIPMGASEGAEIRVSLEGHVPMGGTYASISFQVQEDDE